MYKTFVYSISFSILLTVVSSVQAVPFSIVPTFDGHVSNDADEGPDASPGGTGMHCRNQGGRRRVGFVTYDLSEAQSQGAIFSDISFSNYGHDTGLVNVYGVFEEYEDLVAEGLTWNTAPGVQNDPTPALDSDVVLDLADVTEILLTFNAPSRGTRESTDTSEALADFLNKDTNGFAAFMFAPEGASGAIVRTIEMGEEGGTWLEGDISGRREGAHRPNPPDGALHMDTWLTLSWTPGAFAVSHDVYLGENFDEVGGGTHDSDVFRGNQTAPYYVAGFPGYAYPDGLVPGTTYYWRIDEINEADPNSPWKGDVWSFSIMPKTAYDPVPADGAESVNTNVTLSWTPGMGAKFHTVYFGDDFETVANATEGVSVGTGTYDPGPLKAAKLYYWRVDQFDGVATHKGDVWSFATEGAIANPNPPDGATDVSQTAILTWTAGIPAASHEIYLGTDAEAVRNATTTSPEYKGTKPLGGESYETGKLAWETTYYWRVDEVNDTNPDSPWKGPVWSFTTAAFAIVEDFESYTDDDQAGEAVWQTWIDGFGVADNGAQVGYLLPPYAEQTIVHGGSQSMPLFYNNTAGVTNSEATLTLASVRDWTEEGVVDLSLWFRGLPASVGSFVEDPTGTYTMTAAGTDIWNNADEFHYAFKTLTNGGSIEAQVLSVENTNGWAKAGVMIRETLDAGSKFVAVYITPGNGCRLQARTDTDMAATSDTAVATAEQIALTAPCWVRIERDATGNFRGYYSSDGINWQSMVWRPMLTIASNAYIGLALTSHNPGVACEAKFSNVRTTGTVSGQWASQDIGIASNDAEPLYVAISNASGAPAVVANADPAAAQMDVWTEWRVPLQSFADQGINLSNVDKIAIGLGSKGGAAAGGSGTMYIDDIRLYRP